MTRYILAVGLAGALAMPAVAAAQSTAQPPAQPQPTSKPPSTHTGHTGEQPSSASGLSSADQAFVKEAAIGGMAEVDLGQLAASKATNPDVKQFGQRMVDDHGKANDELKSWASKNSVNLPTELDAKHKAEHARLEKLSGDAFDRAYMTLMVEDHTKDVAAFEKQSKSAKDADLKAWVTKTLPTLQDHLKSAKDVSGKLHAGTAAKAATPKKNPGK
jgi:putative membrane protein